MPGMSEGVNGGDRAFLYLENNVAFVRCPN